MNPITLAKNHKIEFIELKIMANASAFMYLLNFFSFDESVYPLVDESYQL